MKVMISTRDLSKFYAKGRVKALDSLNLEVFEGETFGLLGPNGAGKTTTVRLLNGIIAPSKGTATINGHDILMDAVEAKRCTGLLSESPGLYEKLSAREFLEFVGALYDLPSDKLLHRIDELLRIFSLTSRANDLLEGYSRGMKQKVLIAAAIIHDPEIIFFDEPTSNLDPTAALMVKDLLKELADKAGKTIFISSHILPLIAELCDRVGLIDQGRLVAVGTVSELMERTKKGSLEEAYISLTGGIEERELLSWRS